MIRKASLCFTALLAASVMVFAVDLETSKRVPDGCITVITVSNIQSDSGISWMVDSWLKSARKGSFKELLKGAVPQEMSVAFLPEVKGGSMNALIIMAFPKGAVPSQGLLEGVLKEGGDVKIKTIDYKGTTIAYNAEGKGSAEYGAFAVLGNLLAFGSGPEAIQKAVDGPSVTASANYKKIAAQSPQARDALVFADNAGSQFARFLAPREKKWKASLLLSAQSLAYLGSWFDVVDPSKVSGTIVFQAADKSGIGDIKEDAEFIGEAFKRKFIAEKIQYAGKVEVKDMTVTLAFQLEGLEPLWKSLFDKGVMELFRPE